ncbi:hypothetical protein AN958_07037 [Leucoagaricus sp. SymC.cos]|nr:hypothetical protein AN958_07037 [Leucoagaricus sp. SymC.cos]
MILASQLEVVSLVQAERTEFQILKMDRFLGLGVNLIQLFRQRPRHHNSSL